MDGGDEREQAMRDAVEASAVELMTAAPQDQASDEFSVGEIVEWVSEEAGLSQRVRMVGPAEAPGFWVVRGRMLPSNLPFESVVGAGRLRKVHGEGAAADGTDGTSDGSDRLDGPDESEAAVQRWFTAFARATTEIVYVGVGQGESFDEIESALVDAVRHVLAQHRSIKAKVEAGPPAAADGAPRDTSWIQPGAFARYVEGADPMQYEVVSVLTVNPETTHLHATATVLTKRLVTDGARPEFGDRHEFVPRRVRLSKLYPVQAVDEAVVEAW